MIRGMFRNVEGAIKDPVASWPYEGLVSVIERGLIIDWVPIFREVRRQPWGACARKVERYLSYAPPDGISEAFRRYIELTREQSVQRDVEQVAGSVKSAVQGTGLTAAAFAELIGTSASRLSTYVSGKVTPSAALMLRIERVAREYGNSVPIHEPPVRQ